jgi:hypothetical protein
LLDQGFIACLLLKLPGIGFHIFSGHEGQKRVCLWVFLMCLQKMEQVKYNINHSTKAGFDFQSS